MLKTGIQLSQKTQRLTITKTCWLMVSTEITAVYFEKYADHSGRAVCGMTCLRSLEHWDCGFESHSNNGCLCAFFLYLCCPVCR
jgi:hypothetical protein